MTNSFEKLGRAVDGIDGVDDSTGNAGKSADAGGIADAGDRMTSALRVFGQNLMATRES